MTTDDLLRSQDWPAIRARIAAFAWTRTGKRSWDRANDLAGEAIADACDHGGWDPAKESLEKNLVKRVMSLASTQMRRKRNSFEVRMADAPEYQNVASNDEPTDDVLHRRRVAAEFKVRLVARLAEDEEATSLLAPMMEGIVGPNELAEATGLSIERVAAARRRIVYNAQRVSRELAAELDTEEEVEVTR